MANERVRVVAHGGDLRAGHGRLNRRGNAGLDLVARGRCRAADRALLELDDDRRRGVISRLLRRGSVWQGHSPGLGLANGEERVLDARARARLGGGGLGGVSGEDTARLGTRRERRDAHAGQGEGGGEGECRGGVMGHQWLTYVSTT